MSNYESFIGLEIHIQLQTQSKLFCSCRAHYGDKPNTNVCPVCLGYPGVLPALNREAVKQSLVVCRALNCNLAERSTFDRKNYFYADMTKNYQISQFHTPFGIDGWMEFEIDGTIRVAGIHDVHLEEDAGKMMHEGGRSLIDYNRAGSALLEIVTYPELKTGEEAEAFLQSFRRTVRYLRVCDGNMEEGSLRCDANVSVNAEGAGLGSKVEIKNMNSFRFVRKALNYEIRRQRKLLKAGRAIPQETRHWDEDKNVSIGMRTKEQAHDYRYFPEPDLPPFIPSTQFLEEVDAAMAELPLTRKNRLLQQYALAPDQAHYIADERNTADFFEEVVASGAEPQSAAKWIMGQVAKQLNRHETQIDKAPLTPARLASVLRMIEEGTIHGTIAQKVVEAVFKEDEEPHNIVQSKGWDASVQSSELEELVRRTIEQNPQVVAKLRSGDAKPRGFLVGQVMKATGGTADPQLVQEFINKHIQ